MEHLGSVEFQAHLDLVESQVILVTQVIQAIVARPGLVELEHQDSVDYLDSVAHLAILAILVSVERQDFLAHPD